ncbi:hypothetical protein GCM10009551_034910 [Nocardiopsis tropica]
MPDQQARLRALTLDSSPAARRLRARIPRPPLDPLPSGFPAPAPAARPGGGAAPPGARTDRGPTADALTAPARNASPFPASPGRPGAPRHAAPAAGDARPDGPPVPSAPYAVDGDGSEVPYRPQVPGREAPPGRRVPPGRDTAPRVWPERHHEDTVAVPPAPPVPPACGRPAPGGDGADRPGPRAAVPFGEGADQEAGAHRRAVVRERYREEPAPGAGTRREGGSASHGPGPGRTSRGPAPRASDGPLRRTPDGPAGAPADRRSRDALRDVPADHEERGAGAPGPDPADCLLDPAGPWSEPDEERGRHRRGSRPPSGYTEFVPEPPGAFLERLARRWPPHATLSRRSVLALVAVGALAVTAVLVLHDRPATVRAPEMVAQAASAPAESGPAGDPAGGDAGGGEPSGAVPPDGPAQAGTDADLVVHVGGEVADPGLYTLPAGSRVADAVEEAGGALPDADLDLLNLARALVDGEQVLVGVPQPPVAAGAGTAGGGAAAGTEALVDVNRADGALLETLPGVGPVIARNIIEHREANGPFSSVDELLDVDRIGEKVLADLAPHATAG